MLNLSPRFDPEELASKQTAQYWIDAGEWLPGVPPDQDLLMNLQRVDESEALMRRMRRDDQKGVLRIALWNSPL